MAQRKGTNRANKEARPRGDFERDPDPAATNRDHPTRPGEVRSTPGAGAVGAGANLGVDRDVEGRKPQRAPGARRPGTTVSRPAATPSQGGVGGDINSAASESSQSTSRAPLDVPTGDAEPGPGPSPSELGVPEVSDPNYTAASPSARGEKRARREREQTPRKRGG